MKLSSSVRKQPKYSQGGIVLAIAVSTLNANGLNNLVIGRKADTENPDNELIDTLSLRAGATIHRLEFEDDQAYYNDSTQFGASIYPKHAVGYKFAGKTPALDAFSKVTDLTRTTHLVKTREGVCVLVGGDNGLKNEKNESGSGTASGDFNGFDLVISGAESRKAEIVPLALFEALLAQIDVAAGA